MVDTNTYGIDKKSIRYGYIIAAYNTVVYQLARALRSGALTCQDRFLVKKNVLEEQIVERGIVNHLSPHLRRCIGEDNVLSVGLPNNYKSRSQAREQIQREETSTLFCAGCTKQDSQRGYGMSDPTAGMKTIHDAVLGPDDESFVICYD